MTGQREYSLSGRVFQKLRENILKGVYQENDELREITIGEELGVSRTPVREALRQLELEGLVEIIPNKGAYVRGITAGDVKDIYVMRSLLEGLCARWATEHITEEQLSKMEEVILLSEFHLKEALPDQVVRLDSRFHEILYEASDSKMMYHVLSDFHKYVQMARKDSVMKKERAAQSIREHKAILNAIREKDADRAERLANEHMKNVIENLKKNGFQNE